MKNLILEQANNIMEFSRPDKKGNVYIEIDNGEGSNAILLSKEHLVKIYFWLNEYHRKFQNGAENKSSSVIIKENDGH